MNDAVLVAVTAGILLMMTVFVFLTVRRYVTVGPNQALVVSGRRRMLPDGRVVGFRVVAGGRVWPVPFIERVESLSLEVQTVDLVAEARDAQQVSTRVGVVAQVRIRPDARSLGIAAGLFLSKTPTEVGRIAARTIEDHLKTVIAHLRIEELSLERPRAAELLREEAATDIANMGLEIVSLTISTVGDDHGYLDSIARAKMANVKRDAEIAEAQANRDAAIETARHNEIAERARLDAESAVDAARAVHRCAECGGRNLPEAKYCCQCGKPFPAFP